MANAADLKSAGRFSLVGSIPTRSICTVTTYLVFHPTTRVAFGARLSPRCPLREHLHGIPKVAVVHDRVATEH